MNDTETKVSPATLQPRINHVLQSVELPKSNNEELQQWAHDLFVGSLLVGMGDTAKKTTTKAIRNSFALQLKEEGVVELFTANPYTVSAKVMKGRESFDKDAFMKEVSKRFSISMTDLTRIAASCVKTSASPVSLSVVIDDTTL